MQVLMVDTATYCTYSWQDCNYKIIKDKTIKGRIIQK